MSSNLQQQQYVSTATKTIVENYQKRVIPFGDYFNTAAAPLTSNVINYIAAAGYPNFNEVSRNAVIGATNHYGQVKPHSTDQYKSLDPNGRALVDDMTRELLDITRSDSMTSNIRNTWRANVIPDIVALAGSSPNDKLISELNLNGSMVQITPTNITELMSKFRPLQMYLTESQEINEKIRNGSLSSLLGIVKASGDMRAYQLLLNLINKTESYFALASTVSNIAEVSASITGYKPVLTDVTKSIPIAVLEPVGSSEPQPTNLDTVWGYVDRFHKSLEFFVNQISPIYQIDMSRVMTVLSPQFNGAITPNVSTSLINLLEFFNSAERNYENLKNVEVSKMITAYLPPMLMNKFTQEPVFRDVSIVITALHAHFGNILGMDYNTFVDMFNMALKVSEEPTYLTSILADRSRGSGSSLTAALAMATGDMSVFNLCTHLDICHLTQDLMSQAISLPGYASQATVEAFISYVSSATRGSLVFRATDPGIYKFFNDLKTVWSMGG